jgi:hypothetical protein
LRVYLAEGDAPPAEVAPPPSPRKYWSRRGIAEWLVERLSKDAPTLVGIDHGFSFPLRYFLGGTASSPTGPPFSTISSATDRRRSRLCRFRARGRHGQRRRAHR